MAENYQIVAQRPDVSISTTGIGFDDVWHITYKVTTGASKGTIGTITVPDAEHNAEYVKQTIEDKIKHLDRIASL